MDARDKQVQFELDNDAEAQSSRLAELKAAAESGDVTTPKATRFIARMHAEVKASLDATLAVPTRGVGGKFKGWLRALPTDVTALLAIKSCIEILTNSKPGKPTTIQLLATRIGSLIELEVLIREAEQVNPVYMDKIHDQVKERGTKSKDHLRKLYSVAYDRVMKGALDSRITHVESMHLGKFAVQACIDAGMVEFKTERNKHGTLVRYHLAEEVENFLMDYTEHDVANVVSKATGAMLCPPEEWTALTGGGYLTDRRKMVYPLMNTVRMRRSERKRVREEFTAERMPLVFETANYLQSVAYEIHKPTMEAVQRLWNEGGNVMGVPTREKPAKPPFPFAEDWVKEDAPEHELAAMKAWKRQAQLHYDSLKHWRGKNREIAGFIKVAKMHNSAIWFPAMMDSRGRWYYNGTPNPQGSDISKAALHFHKKKRLGFRGVYWLKVGIANAYGYDKVPFADRAAWVENHWSEIHRALDEPENHPDVWGTDSPWCMFTMAWELREALLSGNPEEYCTGVPIHMDATCSGLQHFSAMLRDPVGGKYVNLLERGEESEKQDIYKRVSLNALEAIKRDQMSGDSKLERLASWWLSQGFDRAMAKKPVMTYVYGATLRGTVEFVMDYMEGEKGVQFPDDEGGRPFDYAMYASRKLFQGIAATVPSAEAAMQWLRNVAKSQPGKRMEWRTPTGFLVQHDYQSYDEVRIKLRSCGVTDIIVREKNEDTHTVKMQNAIAPNFVHALDASHLTFTALLMKSEGLDMVGIHDSFGTHPSDVDFMHAAIREAFIKLYTENDVLGNFLWEVEGFGESPMKGTLNLHSVRDSEFFFC